MLDRKSWLTVSVPVHSKDVNQDQLNSSTPNSSNQVFIVLALSTDTAKKGFTQSVAINSEAQLPTILYVVALRLPMSHT